MKIRIVKNDIIPFDGFLAMTFIPWIFCRKELKDVDVNHEMIHARQQEEMHRVRELPAQVMTGYPTGRGRRVRTS